MARDDDDDDYDPQSVANFYGAGTPGSRAAYQPEVPFDPETPQASTPEYSNVTFPRVYKTLEGGRTGYMPRIPDTLDDPETSHDPTYVPYVQGGFRGYMRDPQEASGQPPDIQGSWDRISADMDRFQQHVQQAAGGGGNIAFGGPRLTTDEDETRAHEVTHGYFQGGMGVPPMIQGSDGQTYLADNEGQPAMLGGKPVTFDQYYQSQRSARGTQEDYDHYMKSRLDNEAASFNSAIARYGYPEAGQEFAGMIDQRSNFLQGLMQQVQNDPNLSARARANALGHLYGQMGQLTTHWQKAQAQTRQKALNSGLHPDYGTPEGPELSPRQQQDVQDTEQALRQIMADDSLSQDQKLQAGTMLSQKLSQLDPLRRYRNGSQPMRAVDKWAAQNYHVDPDTGNTMYFDGKVWKVVPPKPQGKVSGQKGDTFMSQPYAERAKMIHEHIKEFGGTAQEAVAHFNQMDQHMQGIKETQDPEFGAWEPAQDHPDLQRYLNGNAPLVPAMRNMTNATRQELKHIVDAGDQYGSMPARDPKTGQIITEDGHWKWQDDPRLKDRQKRAAALLGLGQPGVIGTADINHPGGLQSLKQKAEAKRAADAKATEIHKRALEFQKASPHLSLDQATELAQGGGSPEDVVPSFTHSQWNQERASAIQHVGKMIGDHEKAISDWQREVRTVEMHNKTKDNERMDPPPRPAGTKWSEDNRANLEREEMLKRGLGTDFDDYQDRHRMLYRGALGRKQSMQQHPEWFNQLQAQPGQPAPQPVPQPAPGGPPDTAEEMASHLDALHQRLTPTLAGVQQGKQNWNPTLEHHLSAIRYLASRLRAGDASKFSPQEKGLLFRAFMIAHHYDPQVPAIEEPPGAFVDDSTAPDWAKKETWLNDWKKAGK